MMTRTQRIQGNILVLLTFATLIFAALSSSAQPPNVPDAGPPTQTPVPQFLPGGPGQPTPPFDIIGAEMICTTACEPASAGEVPFIVILPEPITPTFVRVIRIIWRGYVQTH